MWTALDIHRGRRARGAKSDASGDRRPGRGTASIDRETVSRLTVGRNLRRTAPLLLAICLWSGCIARGHYYSVPPTSGNTVAQLDAQYGFGDLEFGQAPTPDMRLSHRDNLGHEQYIRCPSCAATASMPEVLQRCKQGDQSQCATIAASVTMVGRARVMVYYYFYRNKLTSVEIRALSQDDNRPLLDALRHAFGPGVRRKADEVKSDNSEWWWGEYVTMDYLEPVSERTATVSIGSKWLSDVDLRETDSELWEAKRKSASYQPAEPPYRPTPVTWPMQPVRRFPE